MPCLDAARTLSNARATTSGSRSGDAVVVARAPAARVRLAARRRHRRLAPLLPPRAVPANDSSSSGVSSDVIAAPAPTLDASAAAAIAAATGGGGAMSADSFAATAAPVLQRDSESFFFLFGGRALFVRGAASWQRESAVSELYAGPVEKVSRNAEGGKISPIQNSSHAPSHLFLSRFLPPRPPNSPSSLSLSLSGYSDFVSHFRTASSYIANHRSKTMVVLLPGEVKKRKERGGNKRARRKNKTTFFLKHKVFFFSLSL